MPGPQLSDVVETLNAPIGFATRLDSDVTLTLDGTASIDRLVVYGVSGGDSLAFASSSLFALVGGDIVYNGGTIGTVSQVATVVTFDLDSGVALSTVESLVEALEFTATTDEVPTRNLNLEVVDTDGNSTNDAVDDAPVVVAVQVVDPGPVITNTTGNIHVPGYQEGGTPVPLFADFTLTDPDSTTLTSLTVTNIGNAPAGDTFGYDTSGMSVQPAEGDIVFTYDPAYNGTTLTLSGEYSVADYEAFLQSITFFNESGDPTAGGTRNTRFFGVSASDGEYTTTHPNWQGMLPIGAVNDLPVLTEVDDTLVAVERTDQLLAENAKFSDPDWYGGTVTISGGTDGDTLGLSRTGVSVSSGVVTIEGVAVGTITGEGTQELKFVLDGQSRAEDVQLLLRNVLIRLGSDTPEPTREITIEITDDKGASITPEVITVNASLRDSAPYVVVNQGLTVDEAGAQTITSTLLGASDPDTADADPIYTITQAPARGTLYLDADGNSDLTEDEEFGLGQSFTEADIAAGRVHYVHDGSETTTDDFIFAVSQDGVVRTRQTFSITVTPVNDVPVIEGLRETAEVDEDVALATDSTVSVRDADYDGGGSLSVSGLADGDRVSIAASGGLTTVASNVYYAAALIGTFTGGEGTDFVVTLNGSATIAAVDALIASLQFRATSNDPQASRALSMVFTDGEGAASDPAEITIDVTPVNDAPTVTATATDPTFTEPATADAGTAVALFAGVSADTVDAGQLISGLTMTVSGLEDGGSEQIVIGGLAVPLTNGESVNLLDASAVTVNVAGTTATITVTGLEATRLEANALIEGLAYQNTSQEPTAGTRTVRLTSISDNGGTAAGGEDTGTLNIASTVTVAPTDDPADAVDDAFEAAYGATIGDGLSLFGTNPDTADSDRDSDLVITAVNGEAANVGQAVTLASGAVLTVDADGTFTYDGANAFPDLELYAPEDDTFTYALNGDDTATVTITVTRTNAPPVLTGDLAADVVEGESVTLTTADLYFTDIDDTSAVFTVSDETNGEVRVDDEAATSFTAAQLAGGLVSFVHDGSETGTASFDVSVEDGNEDGSAPVAQTFTLDVTPVNDDPVLTGLDGDEVTFTEGDVSALLDMSQDATVSDADSADFGGGGITVSFTEDGRAEDALSLRSTGVGQGQVFLSNGTIYVGGVAVGSAYGGTNGQDLVIAVGGAQATPEAMTLILRHLSYVNTAGDAPTGGERTIAVTVTDGDGGSTQTAEIALQVVPVNDAPLIVSDGGGASVAVAVSEGQTAVTKVGATDADGDAVTYAITGGADQALFDVDSLTGALAFRDGPDFEAPADADEDNAYVVTVSASDGALSDTQTLTVTVTDVDDSAAATFGDDLIILGSGSDSANGGGGDDTIMGGGGNNTLAGGLGDDAITGGSGRDRITGGAGADTLDGGGGRDSIAGGPGDDALFGGDGIDTVEGGLGNDTIQGDAGDDVLDGGAGDDLIHGGTGDDEITGGLGADALHGEDGEDDIDGGFGDDLLFGGADSDTLQGGAGDDTLDGGAGDDVMTGASGADVFAFAGLFGDDRITDYELGRDTVTMDGYTADDVTVTQTVTGAIIDTDNGQSIEVRVIGSGALEVSDILFL